MTFTIRPASVTDLRAIGQVHTSARASAYATIIPPDALRAVSAAALADWWGQRWAYEQDTHRMAVAQDATGAVLGFSYVGPSPTAGTGELYAIHVDPPFQGAGIGRSLMAGALRTLRELGDSRAVLWVLAENAPARRFYERGGWRGDGGRRRAPVGASLTEQVRYWRALDRAPERVRLGGST